MTTKNKTAIVTGGSRGLGRDMVINLARNGNNIIFTYRNNKVEADKVVQEVVSIGQKARAFQLDVSDIKTFDTFVVQVSQHLLEQEGSPNFDFLINNAGAGVYGSVSETTEEAFDTMMNIHFKGVYFLTQKLLPLLNNGGRIISISSGLTRISFPNVSAYASMKGAIETYTRCLAKELGNRQITANTVAPGAIATDFGGGSNKSDENKRNVIASVTALGRVGEPGDIGGIVAFLCTPEAGWMNGQRIELSGGMMV
ncbi:SDR family oxidoreductase [Rhodocytophaga aerolata]|uniref:SDR family oxidoreductase n=1 Tax=Rhodocytophaga aerolata TaxID=455078 RepID=A0ABT8RC86_9BACT|nr:SDR family oxidoreductase [Rhodocytophaga aerolata]MDO1449718.1 SDR family oxidoreductase [Rhodocytophaga aerolata]